MACSSRDDVESADVLHLQRHGAGADHQSLTVADGRARVENDFSRYDHIGEVVDLPVWEAGILTADLEPPQHLDFDIAGTGAHALYAGGATAPIDSGVCTNNYPVNALARRDRYATDGVSLKHPALQVGATPDSPIQQWLIDTGCGHDLVAIREVRALQAMFRKANIPIMYETASGTTPGNQCLLLHIGELDDTIDPYILASTPAVLSVGKRCLELGYSFIWVAGKRPCFISPGGYLLTLLQVDRNIPYLHRGTPSTNRTEDDVDDVDAALAEAGLCRSNGKLTIDLDVEMQQSAAPAVHFSVESAEDMGMTPE